MMGPANRGRGRSVAKVANVDKKTQNGSNIQVSTCGRRRDTSSGVKPTDNKNTDTSSLKMEPLPTKPRLPPSNIRPVENKNNSRIPPKGAKAPPKPNINATTSELEMRDSLEELTQPPKSQKRDSEIKRATKKQDEKMSELPSELKNATKSPSVDPNMFILLEKIKRLTDENTELAQENQKLKDKLLLAEAGNPSTEPVGWSINRDKMLKSEVLRLRLENQRLRSSIKVNERFGELISGHAREFESMIERVTNDTEEACKQKIEKQALLATTINQIIRFNRSIQSVKMDYLRLREENGAANMKEWDGQFMESDVQYMSKLIIDVSEILLDYEGEIMSKINRLENSTLADVSEVSTLRDTLIAESECILKKNMTLSSIKLDKKSTRELQKKLKMISGLNISSKFSNLKTKLQQNIKGTSSMSTGVTSDPHILKAILSDVDSMRKLANEDSQMAPVVKIGCLLTFIELQIQESYSQKRLEDIIEKTSYLTEKMKEGIAEPTMELFNFLDRSGVNHELYNRLKGVITGNWNWFLAPPPGQSSMMGYAEELAVHTRRLLEELGSQ